MEQSEKKEEIDLENTTNYTDDPDEFAGRCVCGNSSFHLRYVDSKLHRKCKKCGEAKFI